MPDRTDTNEKPQPMPQVHPLTAILALAQSRGIKGIAHQPGLTKLIVDDNWTVWINPHGEAIELERVGKLQPHRFLVTWNDWPASIFHAMQDEIVFVAGEAANLQAFCDAIDAAIKKENPDA